MNDPANIPFPVDGNIGRPLTDEERDEYNRQMKQGESKAIWVQFAMISLQAVKMLGASELTGAQEVAQKAGNLADAMVMEYQRRFH